MKQFEVKIPLGNLLLTVSAIKGGAVAEWSKALLVRENKKTKIKKIPDSAPDLGTF